MGPDDGICGNIFIENVTEIQSLKIQVLCDKISLYVYAIGKLYLFSRYEFKEARINAIWNGCNPSVCNILYAGFNNTQQCFKKAGFIVDIAEDGDVAVSIMSHAKEGQYDLILMDIQMPKMDGYAAAREIRTLPEPEIANISIIAMTANAFEDDKKRTLEAGMNGHIAKPIDISKLMNTLAVILK